MITAFTINVLGHCLHVYNMYDMYQLTGIGCNC